MYMFGKNEGKVVNDEIKISVIIPVYNAQEYLCKCLDSVVNQTYRNLDIILVNDGSTDASGEICDAYARNNSNIRVFHKENGGQSFARMIGIENAVGDYVTFVDSDDYLDIDTYEQILSSVVEDRLPEMIAYDLLEEYGDYITVKRNQFHEGMYDREHIEKEILPNMLSFGDFFNFGILPNLVCKMVRRDYIQNCKISVCEKVRFGEDADMLFQWIPFLKTIQIISYAPYHYNKRIGSMMERIVCQEEIMALKKDLERTFLRSPWRQCLLGQLADYITFIFLLKNPKVVLGENLCEDNTRIALYGAGGFGLAFYKSYEKNIVIWADQNAEYYKKRGFSVVSVENLILKQQKYDVIYIAIIDTCLCEEIRQYLRSCGIKKEIRYYDISDR